MLLNTRLFNAYRIKDAVPIIFLCSLVLTFQFSVVKKEGETIKESIVWYSTLLIYLLTIFFHILVLIGPDKTNWLGISMVIPLITVGIYQHVFLKKNILSTFSLTKPTLVSIILAISIPIILGGSFQAYFFFTKQQYFLFTDIEDILQLLLISFPILMFSALLEEVIWRGNFYVYLRKSFTLLQTAIITAVIWSLWHLPIALFYKGYENLVLGIIGYIGILFILSIILTYISAYGKSVFPAGINVNWKLEYIEFIQFIVLVICFVFFIWFSRVFK